MQNHRDATVIAVRRLAERAAAVAARSAAQLATAGPLTGQARSADGSITVVVSPGGMLTDVTLTPAALRRGSAVVSREVVALAARATRQASGRLHRALSRALDPAATRSLGALGLPPPERRPEPGDDGPVLRRAW